MSSIVASTSNVSSPFRFYRQIEVCASYQIWLLVFVAKQTNILPSCVFKTKIIQKQEMVLGVQKALVCVAKDVSMANEFYQVTQRGDYLQICFEYDKTNVRFKIYDKFRFRNINKTKYIIFEKIWGYFPLALNYFIVLPLKWI